MTKSEVEVDALVDNLVPVGLDLALGDILKLFLSTVDQPVRVGRSYNLGRTQT